MWPLLWNLSACRERGLARLIDVKSTGFCSGQQFCQWLPFRLDPRSLPIAIMKKIYAFLALAGVVHAAVAADVVGNAKSAENKVAMCIGCHGIPGYKASFPEVYQVPMIGGQNAKYLESALKAYQKGDRNHPSMRGIAASLSDQEMADIAAYYSQQK